MVRGEQVRRDRHARRRDRADRAAVCETRRVRRTMLHQAHNWADWEATKRSYELYSRYVMPRFSGDNAPRIASFDWCSEHRDELTEKRAPWRRARCSTSTRPSNCGADGAGGDGAPEDRAGGLVSDGNLLADVPATLAEEELRTLLATADLRIERIVSTGQASPPGFWYDEGWAEWVLVVAGRGRAADRGRGRHRVRWGLAATCIFRSIAGTGWHGPRRRCRRCGWRCITVGRNHRDQSARRTAHLARSSRERSRRAATRAGSAAHTSSPASLRLPTPGTSPGAGLGPLFAAQAREERERCAQFQSA